MEYSRLKRCSKCQIEHDISFFAKSKKSKDGLYYSCKKSTSIQKMAWAKNNKEKVKEIKKRHFKKFPVIYSEQIEGFKKRCRERAKRYREKNRDIVIEMGRKWRRENPGKSNYSRSISPGKAAESWSKRRCIKINATPKWLSLFDKAYIKNIYIQSVELGKIDGIKYNVDHIIPLKSNYVCGLNVPWNLQIIESTENFSKNNRFDGTYDNESWRKSV